ncbi:DUF3265 domain-containing protein [Vibrio vulnificus]|nr:DUF3265 domain-containing protein [Vibrio vulnificus]MCA3945056.1 DUF3265 domain-containing protein [Vibrio vulnificus]
MTRRLSGIHAAWHFLFAVIFGGESGLQKLGLCGIHPLTRRYISNRNQCAFNVIIHWLMRD